MSNPYNRSPISDFSRAKASTVNAEFQKIEAAFATIKAQIDALAVGTGLPSYTWIAYADSADGSTNFTTGEPGNRLYIGIAYNQSTPTEGTTPSAYTWTRFRGADGLDGEDGEDGNPGGNGVDGVNGNYRDIKFRRSFDRPATPTTAEAPGWFEVLPPGTETLWMTIATKNAAGVLLSAWSTPERLSAFSYRGAYASGTTYYLGDTVTFGGGSYILTVNSSAGNAPTGTDQANGFWDVLAAPGSPGEPATPPGAFSATINLTSSSSGANLRSLANAAGYTGMSDATITFNVPSGVTVQGVAGSGRAIDSGTWPSSTYAISIALVIQSGGKVIGGGGHGGNGGDGASGQNGAAGGDGVFCRVPMSVTINSGGELIAGGGGGAGGDGAFVNTGTPTEPEFEGYGGSGGGGGYPNGLGGAGGYGSTSNGNPGANGTISGGGNGGAAVSAGQAGGNGGGAAAAGQNRTTGFGGVAGYAVRKNGNTVSVTNNGTMTGAAS